MNPVRGVDLCLPPAAVLEPLPGKNTGRSKYRGEPASTGGASLPNPLGAGASGCGAAVSSTFRG